MVSDSGMNNLGELAAETIKGMTKEQALATADEFEELAVIIRNQACSACEVCRRPFCSREMVWRN